MSPPMASRSTKNESSIVHLNIRNSTYCIDVPQRSLRMHCTIQYNDCNSQTTPLFSLHAQSINVPQFVLIRFRYVCIDMHGAREVLRLTKTEHTLSDCVSLTVFFLSRFAISHNLDHWSVVFEYAIEPSEDGGGNNDPQNQTFSRKADCASTKRQEMGNRRQKRGKKTCTIIARMLITMVTDTSTFEFLQTRYRHALNAEGSISCLCICS